MKMITAKDLAQETPFSYRFWLGEMKQNKLRHVKNGRHLATTYEWFEEYLENESTEIIDELNI